MIFLKNYFVSTTKETDCVPILHDVRFAIRDSQIPEGLVTITIPGQDASLLIAPEGLEKPLEGCSPSFSLPFKNNEILLEPKQMLYLIDKTNTGKRREFFVQVMGDKPQPQQPQRGRRR